MGEPYSGVDLAVLVLLALAAVRGLARGLVREAFSFAGLAAAILAVLRLGDPATAWLAARAGDALPEAIVRAIAWVTLVVLAFVAVAAVQRLVRRSVEAVGLRLVDRVAGGLVGTAEGALVAALLLSGARLALGDDHALLASSRALPVLDAAREQLAPAPPAVDGHEPPRDVAAPAAPARRER